MDFILKIIILSDIRWQAHVQVSQLNLMSLELQSTLVTLTQSDPDLQLNLFNEIIFKLFGPIDLYTMEVI